MRFLWPAGGVLGLAGAAALAAWAAGGELAASAAAAFLAALISAGAFLWWTSSDRAETRGDLGRGLLISGVIGVAFAWIQYEVNEYQRESDEKRAAAEQRAEARQGLQLTIGLQRNLTGIDLSRRDISRFYFRNKILKEARMVAAQADGANFASANLVAADLRAGRFRGAAFEDAEMRFTELEDADFRGAKFYVEGLEHVSGVFGEIAGDTPRAKLRALRSAGVDLTGSSGAGADFEGAFIPWASLGGAQLEGASFRRADLHGSDLGGVNLRRADLSRANLENAELGAADLTNASLEGANLQGATYDCHTKWPASFDPAEAGVRRVRRPGVVYSHCP
jgi:uncharacterized protein YjbI with pentapeptide repeats